MPTSPLKEITEQLAIVPSIEPADIQSAGSDGESINMGKLDRAFWIALLGAITGNDTHIKAYAGATAGTKTTEIALRYRLSGADALAAGADQFGDFTEVAAGGTGLVFTNAANYDHRCVVVTVKSIDMPAGMPWLTIEVDDGSASGLFMAALFIGVPKYVANDVPTVI